MKLLLIIMLFYNNECKMRLWKDDSVKMWTVLLSMILDTIPALHWGTKKKQLKHVRIYDLWQNFGGFLLVCFPDHTFSLSQCTNNMTLHEKWRALLMRGDLLDYVDTWFARGALNQKSPKYWAVLRFQCTITFSYMNSNFMQLFVFTSK